MESETLPGDGKHEIRMAAEILALNSNPLTVHVSVYKGLRIFDFREWRKGSHLDELF
ncbi:MAG TPA: hypothetical protein VL598_04340 [Trinickia sp.]|jgi:hypothetical protein|uniref:hypothetical protein n=1 Tax=Trinickia sp. TaxID=2571163 RepID=UPI002C1E5C74|nr:hypothetical protein [Trinickia sp.]HTI16872.1 hypothetical protein [Trinickia sp.]